MNVQVASFHTLGMFVMFTASIPVKATAHGHGNTGRGGEALKVIYSVGWDAGSLDGWRPNTIFALASLENTGGNPLGYIRASTDRSEFVPFGIVTDLPLATDSYVDRNVRRISFDLIRFTDTVTTQWFRIRFSDSRFNGWHYAFPVVSPLNLWTSFVIELRPDWTDAQARQAGWEQEPNSASFVETLTDIFSAEVRFEGTGPAAVGIDNFTLEAAVDSTPDACSSPDDGDAILSCLDIETLRYQQVANEWGFAMSSTKVVGSLATAEDFNLCQIDYLTVRLSIDDLEFVIAPNTFESADHQFFKLRQQYFDFGSHQGWLNGYIDCRDGRFYLQYWSYATDLLHLASSPALSCVGVKLEDFQGTCQSRQTCVTMTENADANWDQSFQWVSSSSEPACSEHARKAAKHWHRR